MSMNVPDSYLDWIGNLVCDRQHPYYKYSDLLNMLHNVRYVYQNPMDRNRESDGIDLRYRFAYEEDIDDRIVASTIDNKPCSLLEMIAALAYRCEEHIMSDPDLGDRTPKWFWGMMRNLEIENQDDDIFDEAYVRFCIDRFLNGEYAPDGKGGLFTVKHYKGDLRDVEIWYQMNWYLNETN